MSASKNEGVARYGWNNLPGGNPGWKKGQSGNPKGRPKAPEDIAALCRIHTPECISVLVSTMRNKSHKDRVTASLALLDRGWGKPKQQLEVSADADAIGMHLLAARITAAELAKAYDEQRAKPLPATIEGRPDSATITSALDAPVPTE